MAVNNPSIIYRPNWRGDWVSGTSYSADDGVRSPTNGYLYIASASTSGTTDPGSTDPPVAPWGDLQARIGLLVGPMGDSLRSIYIASDTTPVLPTNPSYDGTSFSNIGSWSETVPATGIIWIAIYEVDADNVLSNPQIIRLSGPKGDDGDDSTVAGPTGTLYSICFSKKKR